MVEVAEPTSGDGDGGWNPDWIVRPGATLQELMDEYHVDEHATAAMTTICETDIIGILYGTIPITLPIAQRLEHTFGPSANFWLALEQAYREGKAAGKVEMP